MNFTYKAHNIYTICKNIGEKVEGNLVCSVNPRNWVIHRNIFKISRIMMNFSKNLQLLV